MNSFYKTASILRSYGEKKESEEFLDIYNNIYNNHSISTLFSLNKMANRSSSSFIKESVKNCKEDILSKFSFFNIFNNNDEDDILEEVHNETEKFLVDVKNRYEKSIKFREQKNKDELYTIFTNFFFIVDKLKFKFGKIAARTRKNQRLYTLTNSISIALSNLENQKNDVEFRHVPEFFKAVYDYFLQLWQSSKTNHSVNINDNKNNQKFLSHFHGEDEKLYNLINSSWTPWQAYKSFAKIWGEDRALELILKYWDKSKVPFFNPDRHPNPSREVEKIRERGLTDYLSS